MDRVTRRIGNSICFVDGKGYAYMSHQEGIRLLFEKLAEYEDLDSQGRLIRLPCELGSMIYRIVTKKSSRATKYSFVYTGYFKLDDIEKFGKTVFLTREEAEVKLKHLRNNG